MSAPRLPIVFVHTDSQWEALCSEARLEVLRFLHSGGPCSIRDLSSAMGWAADGLYHHVHVLAACGLVREVGRRRVGKRMERLYDAAGERLRLDVDISTGRNVDRLLTLVRAVLRGAADAVGSAVRARLVRLDEPIENTLIRGDSARLAEEDIAEVRKHLDAIARIFESRRGTPAGSLHSFAAVLSPLVRARESAGRAKPAGGTIGG